MSDLVFFGHLTGNGSYSVVSRAIAAFLEANIEKTSYKRFFSHDLRERSQFNKPVEPSESTALLFGFPTHWHDVQAFGKCIGYHVCEYELPYSWLNILEDLDKVIVPSAYVCSIFVEAMKTYGITKHPFIVNHGVNPDIFKPKGLPNRDGKLLHYCSSPTIWRKGTDQLLEFLAENPAYARRLKVIFGPEVPINEVRQSLSGGIVCEYEQRYPLTDREFADELREARAVIAPSVAEGFGLVPLQAAACGTPVIFTHTTGHLEFANEIPNSEHRSIEETLNLLGDDRSWQVIADAQRKTTFRLRSRFAWNNVFKEQYLLSIL